MKLKILNEKNDNNKILNEILVTDLPNKQNSQLDADTLRFNAKRDHYNIYADTYGKDISEYKETPKNSKTLLILKGIQASFGSLINASQNILTKLFGTNILFQKVERNEALSNIMTEKFENTKVNVYVYVSDVVNAYTFPGNVIMSHPIIQKIIELLNFTPFKGLLILINPIFTALSFFTMIITHMLSLIEFILKLGIDSIKNGNPWKVIYNPLTNKVNLNISTISVYITSNLIKMLNDDREVEAILLHEIGHNLNHLLNFINHIIGMGFLFGGLSSADNILNDIDKKIKESNSSLSIYQIQFILNLIVYAIILAISFLITKPRKFDEIYADEFAIKMRYGKDLENGLLKLGRFANDRENLGDKSSFIESILNKISRFMNTFIGSYPTDRIKKVHEKTEQYDTSANNIDRSKAIKYIPTDNIY